jgi:hypothetical protein
MTFTVGEAARILGEGRERVKNLAFVFADTLGISSMAGLTLSLMKLLLNQASFISVFPRS